MAIHKGQYRYIPPKPLLGKAVYKLTFLGFDHITAMEIVACYNLEDIGAAIAQAKVDGVHIRHIREYLIDCELRNACTFLKE